MLVGKKHRSTFIDIKPDFEGKSSITAKEQVCVPLNFGLVLQKVASFQVTIFIACRCFFCQPLHTLHLSTASTFLHVYSMQDWSLKCFNEIASFSQCYGHIPLTIPGIPFWTFCLFVRHSACLQECIMSFVITRER